MRGAFEWLERCAVKVARTVLRGLGASNGPWLPDQLTLSSVRRWFEGNVGTRTRTFLFGDQDGYFWNGHIVISDPLGSLRATAQDKEGYLIYELGFDANQSWLKRIIGNMIVKAPVLLHVLRNWRRVREYR